MYPLFESLCIQNGKILNSKWHEKRFRNAYLKYFGKSAYFNLLDEINIPKEFKKGNVKLRVLYGETGRKIQFEIYKLRKIIDHISIIDNVILACLFFYLHNPLAPRKVFFS